MTKIIIRQNLRDENIREKKKTCFSQKIKEEKKYK